jgi:hypothetical protein
LKYGERRASEILATVLFVYSAAVRSSAFSARTARRDSFVFLIIYDRRRAWHASLQGFEAVQSSRSPQF